MNVASLKAAALALAIGLIPATELTAPAEAGSVTIKVTPKGKRAKALQRGLTVWSKIRERRNRARIDQRGSNNSAHASQSGSGNTLGVFQRGSGHSATSSQSGGNNTLGIFQFGKNTSSNVDQTGGQFGLIFQGGW